MNNSFRGFTLVETLVAVAIISLAVVAPFISIDRSLVASYTARDDLVASALAQEGEEHVIYLRDNNFLQGRASWTTYMASYLSGPTSYPPSDTSLRKRFTRTIQINQTTTDEIEVIVVVTWTTEGAPHSMTVTDYLENWL